MEVEVIYIATGPYMGLNYVNTSVLTVPFFFFRESLLNYRIGEITRNH